MQALILALVLAAPTPAKADVLIGEFDLQSQSPVVYLPDADEPGGRKVYWLVCVRKDTENQTRKFIPGERVKITGRVTATGQYRYIIVDSAAPAGKE